MVNLDIQIKELNNYLLLVSNSLDNLNDENFSQNMNEIKSLIKKIDDKKDYIRSKASKDVLENKCDGIHRVVKQIRSRFDDIIKEKKEKQQSISFELNNLVNQKKLINYQR